MMTRLFGLTIAAAACALAAFPASAQTRSEEARWEEAQRRFEHEQSVYEAERDRYEAARRRGSRYGRGDRYGDDRYRNDDYSRYETDYDAARYYRDDPRYRERVLSADDEVYRGSDGRYYCRRSDGTTGLIVGGAAGGVLGNVIDGGRQRTAGTLIGGALGALLGREVERNEVRCR
jgi:hypothetical protein